MVVDFSATSSALRSLVVIDRSAFHLSNVRSATFESQIQRMIDGSAWLCFGQVRRLDFTLPLHLLHPSQGQFANCTRQCQLFFPFVPRLFPAKDLFENLLCRNFRTRVSIGAARGFEPLDPRIA
jgi:hypothetical protein